jgi:hypothetical protein
LHSKDLKKVEGGGSEAETGGDVGSRMADEHERKRSSVVKTRSLMLIMSETKKAFFAENELSEKTKNVWTKYELTLIDPRSFFYSNLA